MSFKDYVNGTDNLEAIPKEPDEHFDSKYTDYFRRSLFVDGRIPERIGLIETCTLAGLIYRKDMPTLVAAEPDRVKTGARWMYCQTGAKNVGRNGEEARKEYLVDEVGMSAEEGIFVHIDDPNTVYRRGGESFFMHLVGSLCRSWGDLNYEVCATIDLEEHGRPILGIRLNGQRYLNSGAATRLG